MQKPEKDEIEVSIFGPGYGECIVIHIGNNEWVVIDSCINPDTKKNAAIEYLNHIGVDLDAIKLLVASHWHDDHIRGFFELLKNCKNAKIAISDAFCEKDFIKLASVFNGNSDLGATEFSNIWKYLLDNKKYPIRASGNRLPILVKEFKDLNIDCEIKSLSPSDAAITLSNVNVAKIIPSKPQLNKLPALKTRVTAISPNHAAVVLLITINQIEILLGSDLENSSNEQIGWVAILNSGITCKANLFKVPHHGSENGDNPFVWEKLICKDPITITTPFVNGSVKLPKESDLQRIKEHSGQAFLTAEPKTKKAKSNHFVDKILQGDIIKRKLANPFYGHVRLRCKTHLPVEWESFLSKNSIQII